MAKTCLNYRSESKCLPFAVSQYMHYKYAYMVMLLWPSWLTHQQFVWLCTVTAGCPQCWEFAVHVPAWMLWAFTAAHAFVRPNPCFGCGALLDHDSLKPAQVTTQTQVYFAYRRWSWWTATVARWNICTQYSFPPSGRHAWHCVLWRRQALRSGTVEIDCNCR